MSNPNRGEIWLVDLNPTRGQELQKIRPVVVILLASFTPYLTDQINADVVYRGKLKA